MRLKVGGKSGRIFRLKPGAVLVIPAGIGHCRVGPDEGLKVVGAYPRGQSHYDMKRRGRAVPSVPLPHMDPLYGELGPTVRLWAQTETGPVSKSGRK